MYLSVIDLKMIQVIVHDNLLAFFCLKKQMLAWIIFGILILVLVGFLVIPIRLYANTISKQYFARIGHLAKAYLEEDKKEIIRFRIRVLGYQFILYPLKKKGKRSKIKTSKKRAAKRKHNVRQVFRMVKALKVHTFELNLDTGNYFTNAKLYPVFGFINHHFANCQINYQGVNYLIIDIRSRPITLLRSFIHY